MLCSNCGTDNSEASRFCKKCGSGMESSAPLLGSTSNPVAESKTFQPRFSAGISSGTSQPAAPYVPKPYVPKAPPTQDILRRSASLYAVLLVEVYLATSWFCGGFDWPRGYATLTSGPDVGKPCYKSNYGFALNPTGHPLCYQSCTPLNLETVLDLFVGVTFLALLWCGGEYLLHAFSVMLGEEIHGGKEWQKVLDAQDEQEGLNAPAHKRREVVHHSSQWNEQLYGWRERKKLQKSIFGGGVKKRAAMFYAFYFVLGICDLRAVHGISPKQRASVASYGSVQYISDLVHAFFKPQFSGWYTYLIVSVVLMEAVLFFSACLLVRWPRPSLIRSEQVLQKKIQPKGQFFKKPTGVVEMLQDEHPGLVQDTCLLIACHESCLTPDRQKTFGNTLLAAMRVFPPSAIFVCDNGNTLFPVCRTQQLCDKLSRDADPTGKHKVNYLFIPEGNKTHAMYWCTEYWIPELVRRGESQDYRFAMIIDDDVPLPPDLHVPNNTLNRNQDIKAVAYVICAATENGNYNQLVELQDLEYKMAGLVKQFQFLGGSAQCCHGAIALWRRDVLGSKILWDHDTVFHGEDLYMGLLLHRMKMNYAIMASAGAVVPTFAPEILLILFRQRVKSWDLCAQRKFLTFVREFVLGWCGGTKTWLLKPFMFQEVLNIILDWMRLFLLIGLCQRDPISLLTCFYVFFGILYFEIALFNYGVLRTRTDLAVHWKTLLMFPFYRTLCLIFRLYAVMENAINYSSWGRKGLKISEREENIQDMPPVPPVIDPDWHTIWLQNTHENEDDQQLERFTNELVANLHTENAADKRRLNAVVQAYLLYLKLLSEDSQADFPGCLNLLGNGGGADAMLLGNSMETLRATFVMKLQTMLGGQWAGFESRLGEVLSIWAQSNQTLFFNSEYAVHSADNTRVIVKSNQMVLSSVSELVHSTKYPANHDKVADLKECLKNVMDFMQLQVQTDRRRASTVLTLNDMLHQLENIRGFILARDMDKLQKAASDLTTLQSHARTMDLEEQWRVNILQIAKEYQRDIANILSGDGSGGQPATAN